MSFVSLGVGGSLALAGGAGALGSLGSALISASAAKTASGQQVQLGQEALTVQEQLAQMGMTQDLSMFNTAMTALQPQLGTGQGIVNQGQGAIAGVLPTLESLLTPGPNQTQTLSQLPGF